MGARERERETAKHARVRQGVRGAGSGCQGVRGRVSGCQSQRRVADASLSLRCEHLPRILYSVHTSLYELHTHTRIYPVNTSQTPFMSPFVSASRRPAGDAAGSGCSVPLLRRGGTQCGHQPSPRGRNLEFAGYVCGRRREVGERREGRGKEGRD